MILNRGLHSQGPSGCVENLENLHRDLANVKECKSMVIIIAIRRLLIKGISTGTDLTKTYNFETKNKRFQTFFSGEKEPRTHPLQTMQRDSHINTGSKISNSRD